jgi:hypothetical protein
LIHSLHGTPGDDLFFFSLSQLELYIYALLITIEKNHFPRGFTPWDASFSRLRAFYHCVCGFSIIQREKVKERIYFAYIINVSYHLSLMLISFNVFYLLFSSPQNEKNSCVVKWRFQKRFLHHLIVPCYSQMPKSFFQTSGSLIEQCLHAVAVMLDGLVHQRWRK